MFGLFSGDKKTQQTTTNTSTEQTDSSKNLGTNATLVESGGSFVVQDVSEYVARDALAATADVAKTSVNASAVLGEDALKLAAQNTDTAFRFGAQVADSALEKVYDSAANTQMAAQNAVSYGRSLAELGFSAKTSADTGGATATIDSLAKFAVPLAVGAALIAAALYFRSK